MEDTNKAESKEKSHGDWSATGVMWWTTLLITAVAVPSFGFAMSYLFPFRGILQLVVFILACWLCTYLGMRLMDNPKMSGMIGSDKKKE
jgi:hypothetical protein